MFVWLHLDTLVTFSPPLPSLQGDCDAIQDYLRELTGARSVPRVFIGGKCIGGGTETQELAQKGKLVTMLKEVGAL